jgi:CubicO group peptidase (beta-lactamase class C family)
LVTRFEVYVEDLLARMNVPRSAVAVDQDGKVVYANGFGVKEQGGSEPVTPSTLMMIGSTTKSMTTMMMATEVDANGDDYVMQRKFRAPTEQGEVVMVIAEEVD